MNSPETIVWRSNFETGVAEIDEQHRILVNTLNDANAKLRDDSDFDIWERCTRDLLSYALYHFNTEETLAAKYGYNNEESADAMSHWQQHRSFSAKVVQVREGLKSGNRISKNDLIAFLNGWLVDHILTTDHCLAAFICEKRRQLEASSHPRQV